MSAVAIVDCSHASDDDCARGVAAALEVFAAAKLTPAECNQAANDLADGVPCAGHSFELSIWCEAERAALAACCAGWIRIPEPAHLELVYADN